MYLNAYNSVIKHFDVLFWNNLKIVHEYFLFKFKYSLIATIFVVILVHQTNTLFSKSKVFVLVRKQEVF